MEDRIGGANNVVAEVAKALDRTPVMRRIWDQIGSRGFGLRDVAIIGYGGYAKVVASALRALGRNIVAYTCLAPDVSNNPVIPRGITTEEALMEIRASCLLGCAGVQC
jgi:phosphoglycerate dehydrogenase-like enzyme